MPVSAEGLNNFNEVWRPEIVEGVTGINKCNIE
jgi:hypothetical protein